MLPSDNTEAICRDFAASDPRIRYFRNTENIGAAGNYNRCFELARRNYFKWCAHDDFISSNYVGECVEALEKDGASFRGFVCYAAVGRDGYTLHGRIAIALRSVWAAIRFTPIGSGLFARLATDFTRHCLYRPLNMGRVDLLVIGAAQPAADFDCAMV